MSGALRHRLRTETADLHHAVDAAFDPDTTLASRESYAKAIGLLHGALDRAMTGLAALPLNDWGVFIRRTDERLKWLQADIGALGGHGDTPSGQSLSLSSPAAGLGCLYVLEGSALGGQLVGRLAEARLGIHAGNGGRYFHGLGRQTGEGWRRFLEVLNAVPAQGRFADDALDGAKRTFALFEGALARDAQRP